MLLSDLASYLDTELNHALIGDYSTALNGLQMENPSQQVTKIIAAVDACLPVMREAVQRGGDLLLVHHGLFWSGLQTYTGSVYEKLRLGVQQNLAVYASHLPLDVHPEWGNNAQLTRALGFTSHGTWMKSKGQDIGLYSDTKMECAVLAAKLEKVLGGSSVHICAGGPAMTRRIGIVTGGAGTELAAAKAAGIDTFITGEGPHWSYTLAEELGINLLYAGHYATETFGVKALAAHLAEKFQLSWEFVDHPTGL
jgi:dinuclear metal center YbgI/SA1388 family protein